MEQIKEITAEICPFTALDARKIAEQKQEEVKRGYFQQIQEHIFNAARVGKYDVEFEDTDPLYNISRECKDILEKRGFSVKTFNRNYLHGIQISWKEEEQNGKRC
jgi:hypothetical protein